MTQTLSERIKGMNLRFRTEPTFHNPNMDDSHMNHWKCTIRNGRKQMTITFSKGLGLHGEPATLEEVLDCLASDAAGYENAGSFELRCDEYGYDTDSRKAEKTYNLIGKQAKTLKYILGEENYNALLWDTERA